MCSILFACVVHGCVSTFVSVEARAVFLSCFPFLKECTWNFHGDFPESIATFGNITIFFLKKFCLSMIWEVVRLPGGDMGNCGQLSTHSRQRPTGQSRASTRVELGKLVSLLEVGSMGEGLLT